MASWADPWRARKGVLDESLARPQGLHGLYQPELILPGCAERPRRLDDLPRDRVEALPARQQLVLDARTMSKFVEKVREALFFQMRAGSVERESAIDIKLGDHDQRQRFRLSRKMFRS